MKTLTKQEQVDEAGKAYRAINEPAYKAYRAINEPAWKAHLAIVDPAEKAYRAINEPAWKAYRAIAAPAWIAYQAKVEEIIAQPDEVKTIITHNNKEYRLVEDAQ